MGVLTETVRQFLEDDCPRMAAALSYYTVFSLPGLLILVLAAASLFADPVAVRGVLVDHIQAMAGADVAGQVDGMLLNLERPGDGHPVAIMVGIGALLFAATVAFHQLQVTLNRAWQVEPDPARGGVRNFVIKRVFSFAMILGVAALLLAALLTQTLLTAFADLVAALTPDPVTGPLLQGASFALSFAVATAVFGLVFQILPDAEVEWRDAWRGAAATALLFLLGNVGLGLYLARSNPGSAFGAAGSLALVLIWLYYSSMIFFLGAELTQVLASRRGEGIRPSRGAVRVVVERRAVESR